MSAHSQLFLASAGTGKTFQLTTHYLRLVCDDVPHERILASTFTRKAAGEILSRIFSRLAAAASSAPGAAQLDRELGRALGQERYRALLARLARGIARFRVSTLDAFFVELAQGLAPELGLPPDWRIADEVDLERGRDAAVAAALGALEREQWSVLLRELERGELTRGVHSRLTAIVKEAYVLFQDSTPQAWDNPEPAPAPTPEVLNGMPARASALSVPSTKGGTLSKHWFNSRSSLIELLGSGQLAERVHEPSFLKAAEALLSKGVAAKLLAGESEFSSHPIQADWEGLLQDLFRVLAAQATRMLAAHNRAAQRIIAAYDEHHRRERLARRRLGFDEVARALAGRPGAAERELGLDLALRMDAAVDHLLLDEFQDTSPVQWRVLRRLAEELAADGTGQRSFFCVGDVKQSIYGWRSAEPRLLLQLGQHLNLPETPLDESYRSAQVVLDAVNLVFSGVGGYVGFADDTGALRAAQAFEQSFHAHSARRPLAGEVHVHTGANGADAAENERACMERAVEVVDEIRARAPGSNVAVLLRRNRHASFLLARLRARGIAASGEGGNPLTDSISVQAALAALHWLDHPGDTVARFHAASSALGAVLGLSVEPSAAQAEACHRRQRRALADLGLPAWLAQLRAPVAARHALWEQRRFAQLIDFALGADPLGTPGDFCARVRRERVEDASSARVKVMTVHASKGLEFDAVVLPELDYAWDAKDGTFVWRRENDDPEREIEVVSRSCSRETRSLLARVGVELPGELHDVSRERAMRDELSGLYVAMTRARHRLDIVLRPVVNKEGRPAKSAACVVRGAFGIGHGSLSASASVYSQPNSSGAWAAERPAAAGGAPSGPPAHVALTLAAPRRARELERASPSDLEVPGERALSTLFEVVASAGRLRGSRFHAWFERVEWLDDFSESDELLRRVAEEQGYGGDELERDLAEFRAALQRPGLRALLTRPAQACEVWRERRFRRVIGGRLVSGAFDRVVVERAGGRAVRARLIDFKSDRSVASEEQLAALAEHYRPQLEAYRAALAGICALELSEVEAVLYFVGADRVRTLAGS